jgi:hypothetical protein
MCARSDPKAKVQIAKRAKEMLYKNSKLIEDERAADRKMKGSTGIRP